MAKKNEFEKPALDLLEEAVHLLRTAPPGALIRYYTGTIPFILGLLFFWADMSRSAYAASRCAGASFLLALLFIWMKCWQSGFAHALWRRLGGQAGRDWNWLRIGRLAVTQTLLQPVGLILLPLPVPWIYGFFQNVTVFGLAESKGVDEVARRAWKQSVLWPTQHFVMLSYLFLFGFFVYLNILIGMLFLPQLLKMFLGVETAFTRGPGAFLNSTFMATGFALAYLCLDPLVKAVYTVRCFQGESLQTGEALWAELQRLRRTGAVLFLLAALGLGLAAAPAIGRTAELKSAPSVSAGELDRSIRETIEHPRYSWRMPREGLKQEEKGGTSLLKSVLDYLVGLIERIFRAIGRAIGQLIRWLAKVFIRNAPEGAPVNLSAMLSATQMLLYALMALVLCTLVIFLVRLWQGRPPRSAVAVARALAAADPDLNDEQTAADRLPVDGWLKLARELAERGEPRLALRAFYLACLAVLAEREWIRIRKSKSNHEYERELGRRAHTRPGLLDLFAQSVIVFERAWYGRHEVTPDGLDWFQAHYERIKSLVQ